MDHVYDMGVPASPAMSVATVAPPNMDNVTELMGIMRQTMDTLGGTFEALNQTTARVQDIQAEPALDGVKQIRDLRTQLVKRDKRQELKMLEIERLLKEVLQDEIVEHLKGQIEGQISDIIDQEVERQVQLQLTKHIPEQLQDTFHSQKRQLDEVRFSLQNSEARRSNNLLRANQMQGTIAPLIGPSGTVSEKFPTSMNQLLNVDADVAAELVAHYGIPEAPSREENLNNFMRHCNIGYQVVPLDRNMSMAITL